MSRSLSTSSLVIGAIILVCLACGGRTPVVKETQPTPPSSDNVKVTQVADVTKLIRQGPAVFDTTFGKAVEAFETDDPGTMPGEMRDYKIPGVSNPQTTTAGMTVRFYKGKAVEIMIDLPSPTNSSAAALMQVGLDTQGAAPELAQLADYWSNKTFNSVKFKGVWAYKLDVDSPMFTTIKAASE